MGPAGGYGAAMTEPRPDVITKLEPALTRVLAPNASPMTYWGTNSYVIGQERLAVIDPGPLSAPHLEALLGAIAGRPVEAILVTHAHVDHSPLARPLAEATGAPILAFGPADAGRSPVMTRLAKAGLTTGGEGVDAGFAPDTCLADGETVTGPDWQLEALHTPGHFGNHLSFAWGARLFCGDHMMGWSSSLVSPPDGDLTDFMASSARLAARPWRIAHPGHGAPIPEPEARLAWLIAHRQSREAQILAALAAPHDLSALTSAIYSDIPPQMHPAAARNLFAHLVDLHARGLLRALPDLRETAVFEKI